MSHTTGRTRFIGLVALLAGLAAVAGARGPAGKPPVKQPGVLKAEFIYEKAPFPQCHASTLAESRGTLIAAWFGGTREKPPDVGIWVARHDGANWSTPVEVAD